MMFLTLYVRLYLYFIYKKTNYTHLSRGLIEMYVGFFNDVIDDVIDEIAADVSDGKVALYTIFDWDTVQYISVLVQSNVKPK